MDVFTTLLNTILRANPEYSGLLGGIFGAGEGNIERTESEKYGGVGDNPIITQRRIVPEDYRVGAYALMNEHAILTCGNKGNNYKDLGNNLWFGEASPTAKNLVQFWNEKNPFAPYKIEDFYYAKHYGLIPNTHLITLRRFYRPTFDNMQVHVRKDDPDFLGTDRQALKKIHYPISTAVTWFGNETGNELSKLLGFSCGIPWEAISGDVQDVSKGGVNYDGNSKTMKSLFQTLGFLSGDANMKQTGDGYGWGGIDLYKDGPYQNRVYGPINVITDTNKRKRGLTFEQSFELNFTYALRSIDSNNPKVVMLDILSNFLALCFNFGEFWGGMYRYNPGSYANAPIPGGIGFIAQLHTGNIDEIIKASQNVLTQLSSNIAKNTTSFIDTLKEGGLKGGLDKILGVMQSSGFMHKLIGSIASKDMTSIASMPPLLTGDPIGEWHLTVGNPFNPTLMVGNLLCESMDVEFNDELSIEGFPTEMTFKIKLKHGRGRDAGDIQSMFNRGNGRIYHYNDSSINSSASSRNTNNDTGNELAKKFGFDSTQGEKLRKE